MSIAQIPQNPLFNSNNSDEVELNEADINELAVLAQPPSNQQSINKNEFQYPNLEHFKQFE